MSTLKFVRIADFDPSKIIPSSPQSKDVPVKKDQAPGTGGKYQEVKLSYNYGTTETPFVDDLRIEWPEVNSKRGIEEKKEGEGRSTWSIMFDLPVTDGSPTRTVVEKMTILHLAVGQCLAQVKGQLGMPHFNPSHENSMIEATGFKSPIYYSRDKVTSQIIAGRTPTMYVKLVKTGYGAMETKTLFSLPYDPSVSPAPPPIDWSLLTGVELKCIPLIHIEKVYIGGGKMSLQVKLQSAVVTHMVARNSTSPQTSTMENLLAGDPEMAKRIREQMTKLAEARGVSAPELSPVPVPTVSPTLNLPQPSMSTISGVTSSVLDFMKGTTAVSS